MKLKELWQENRMLIVLAVMVIVLTILGLTGMGTQSFVTDGPFRTHPGLVILHGGRRTDTHFRSDGCA